MRHMGSHNSTVHMRHMGSHNGTVHMRHMGSHDGTVHIRGGCACGKRGRASAHTGAQVHARWVSVRKMRRRLQCTQASARRAYDDAGQRTDAHTQAQASGRHACKAVRGPCARAPMPTHR